MAIPILDLLSNLWKTFQPRQTAGSHHLMLAGIESGVFLRQWGTPDIKTSLNQFRASYEIDFLALNTGSIEGGSVTVWIYRKMDLVVFFREEKLISHFKWSQFKKKFKGLNEGVDARDQDEGFYSYGPDLLTRSKGDESTSVEHASPGIID